MTRRLFAIEWNDDLGPMWMNKDNLMACLNAYCPNTEFVVEDISPADEKEEVRTTRRWEDGQWLYYEWYVNDLANKLEEATGATTDAG